MSENRLQVLLVEDNAADARLIREVLADAELGHAAAMPFRLLTADRLATGLARLAENGADVVLLDLSLPDSQGLNTLVSVTAQAPAVPIVVLTGLDNEEVAVRALQEGAQDYLVKGQVEGTLLVRTIRYAIERKRAEAALRESEAHTRLIVDTALDAAITIDAEGRITSWNAQAEAIFGWPRQNAVGRLLSDTIIPPQYGDAHRRGLKHFLATGEGPVLNKRIEITALHQDGREFPVELAISPVKSGETFTFSAFVRDITERKRADEALRASERQLSLVYDNVSDIIFYLAVESDDRFRFVSINPAFLKATGLTESQVVGQLVQEVIPEPAHALVLGNYEEAIRDKKTVTWEEVSVYPTGTKHGEVSVTPIFDANGHCTNLIGTVHDITERKQAEEEIRQLNAELEHRVLERTAQLEAANQELEAFSYSVSHDLRAPLRAVIGFAGAVLEDYAERLDAEGRRYLTIIHDSARNMGQLIDDLLMLSRLGRQQMTLSEIDMTALARSVAEELQRAMPERALQFVIPALPTARGDRALIHQVWVNLLSNAVKFTRFRDQAVIEVGGKAGASENVYVVRDNGVGFDNRYVDKLFGVFQRLHGADEFEGTGIGLSIVRRVIHRHGGQVCAEGQVERGAAFYFTLPVQETKDEHDL